MWVRNAWYVAGWSPEFAPGAIHARTIIDQPIALYRTADGGLAALEDRCCHRFAPALDGPAGGRRPALHVSRAEVRARRTLHRNPRPAAHPAERLLCAAFPSPCSGSWVWVWMGECGSADPAAIPPSLALDDPDYRLKAGHLDYAAHYLLIDDNLLDLSHLSPSRTRRRWASTCRNGPTNGRACCRWSAACACSAGSPATGRAAS